MKKKSKLDKILLWFVIWSAVAWTIWAASQTKKWKEITQKIWNKISETSKEISEKIREKSEKKKSFWHGLNKIFFKK